MKGWLISVITVNLNNKSGLEQTISSVQGQTYAHLEYIVIDGGSTDGSRELLNNQAINFSISEKDTGIYQAMNKGIAKASGQYCLFLNSGDYFSKPSIVEDAVRLMGESDQAGIFYGDLLINNIKGSYPAKISLEFLLQRSLPHPATFFKTSLFQTKNVGLYNEKYKIVSDWIFFLTAYLQQVKFKKIDLAIAVYDTGGISSINTKLNDLERRSVMENIFPNLEADLADLREMHIYRSSRPHKAIKKIKKLLNGLKRKDG